MKLRYIPIAVFVVLALTFAANRAYWAYWVSVERDKLRELGYPATKEEFAEWYTLPEGTPNAAELYKQAFELYTTEGIDFEHIVISGSAADPLGTRLARSVREETARFVQANRETIKLLEDAAKVSTSYREADFTQSAYELTLKNLDAESLAEHLSVARLLGDAALYHQDANDPDASLAIVRAQFGLGRSMHRDFQGSAALSAVGVDMIAFESAKNLLTLPSVDDSHLDELDELLNREVVYRSADMYLLSSVCLESGLAEMFLSEPKEAVLGLFTWDGLVSAYETAVAQSDRALYDLIKVTNWHFYSQTLLTSGLAYEPVPAELTAAADPSLAPGGVINALLIRNALSTIQIFREKRIEMQLLRLAAAVERQRLVDGTLPSSLQLINSEFLPRVVDPYSGVAFKYTVYGDDYWLYSVGPNGIDDGGYDSSGDRDLGDDVAVAIMRSTTSDGQIEDAPLAE